MVFKTYDNIIITAEHTLREFNAQRLPLTALDLIIDKAKMELPPEKNLQVIQKQLNKTLVSFKELCHTHTDEHMKDGNISIAEIKIFIGEYKAAFVRGQMIAEL